MAPGKPKLDVENASSANSYAILAKLATGGMAELFLARTVSTAGVERYVVLKRVLPNRVKDTNFVAMFLDEAKLVSQLQHPNIAQIYDTGMLGDSYFFSMEYVHGETVRELIHRAKALEQPIPIGCAITIVAQAAAGLHHAHERLGMDGKPLGIVHRDVSPSNLMVTYEGNVKVVDFGVAKATRRSSVDTQAGLVKGKIGYLSPEQCRGRDSDRRSDLFSLGIVLWELLVGDRMYKRDNDYDTMEAIVLDPPTPPSVFRSEVPPELDAIVMKLLAKAPGDRYQTGDELHDALEELAETSSFRISTAALRRSIVELCGKRPEPWLEMSTRDPAQEVVTVSAAVIGGLDTVLTSLTDSDLTRVPDLTNTPSAPRRTPTPSGFAAVMDIGDDTTNDRIGARKPSLAPSHASPKPSSVSTLRVRAHRSKWTVIALLACGVAAAALYVVVFRGGTEPASPLAASSASDVPKPDVSDVPKPDVPKPDVPKPDVPKPDVPKPDVVQKEAKPDEVRKKPEASRVHVERSRPRVDVASTVRVGKYDDAVAMCVLGGRTLAQNLQNCTLAACHVHETANARAWFAKLPARARDQVAAECSAAGTVVVEAKKATVEEPKKVVVEPKVPPTNANTGTSNSGSKDCDDPDGMSCRK